MKGILLLLILLLCPRVCAAEFAPPGVPDAGANWMPSVTDNLADGLLELIIDGALQMHPHLEEALGVCIRIVFLILLVHICSAVSEQNKRTRDLVCSAGISLVFLKSANALIPMGARTVTELSEYGKVLLPVMASAMAAQGGITASASIYAGTMVFDHILSSMIANLLVPMIYVFLSLSIAGAALQNDLLGRMRTFAKSLCTWSLKTILYVFTGYIGITGVVSGTTDAAALKAAKLTISGVVPVVGGILSDASEAVLVSAGLAKNAAGIYGILALFSVTMGPFLRLGAHYLMLKLTAVVCQVFADKQHAQLVDDFCSSMGLLLAMTGSVCLLLMISVVCFLRGVG